jgi:hypothetical protein
MDTDRRVLELVGQDLIADWGDLHNQVRSLAYQASELQRASLKLEAMIDSHVTLILKTVGDALEEELTLPLR